MRSVLVQQQQQLNLKHCHLAKRYFLSSGWERTHHRLSICIIMYVPRVSNPLLRPRNVSFNIVNERMYEWIKSISMLSSSSSSTLMRRTNRAFISLGQNYVCTYVYVCVSESGQSKCTNYIRNYRSGMCCSLSKPFSKNYSKGNYSEHATRWLANKVGHSYSSNNNSFGQFVVRVYDVRVRVCVHVRVCACIYTESEKSEYNEPHRNGNRAKIS